jgi:hypothetical protein
MFQALLVHPQEALNKRHLVYCVRILSAILLLFHQAPITCHSLTHHVILTSFPNYTTAHLSRPPTAIHDASPLSFSRQHFTTKHHGRTSPTRADGRSRYPNQTLSTSSPQRVNSISICTNKLFGKCTPLFRGPTGYRPSPTHSPTSTHPYIFPNVSTHYHTSFFRAEPNGLTTQSKGLST